MSVLFDDEHPYWCTQTRMVLFEKTRKPLISPGVYAIEYDTNIWPPPTFFWDHDDKLYMTLEDGEIINGRLG